MGEHSHLGQRGQSLEVAVVDASYLEDVVGAHDHAVPLRFASSVIDDRGPATRHGVTPLPGAVGVLSRPAPLGQLFGFR